MTSPFSVYHLIPLYPTDLVLASVLEPFVLVVSQGRPRLILDITRGHNVIASLTKIT
jgi:hypothetical protein